MLGLCALETPVFVFYLAHYLHAQRIGKAPTGFIQYDQANYMAFARMAFDHGLSLTYGNPFSPNNGTPRIYFHPDIWFLGALRAVLKIDPGLLFMLFGFTMGLLAIAVAAGIFRDLFGLAGLARKLTFVCFVWGGGVLALTGSIVTIARHDGGIDKVFRFDPGSGWWFLNFGRNLIYPLEAYYHLLALSILWLLMRGRHGAAVAVLAVLSLSHPFTGAQYIGIVGAWLTLERFVLRNRRVPLGAWFAVAAIGAFHVGYNLFYLSSFPEHASVETQCALAWNLSFSSTVPAYALVYGMVLLRLRHDGRWRLKEVFADPVNRLLGSAWLISVLLENHELFMKARQPLHFTRGHAWTALFLLGAPALIRAFTRIGALRVPWLRIAGAASLLGIFLADNALWLGGHLLKPQGIYLNPTQSAAIAWITEHAPRQALVLSDDEDLMYAVTVYTPFRVWYSHWANTPFIDQRRAEGQLFFKTGQRPAAWSGRDMVIVERGVPRLVTSDAVHVSELAPRNAHPLE